MADFNCRVFGIVENGNGEILLIRRSGNYLPQSSEFIGWEICGGGLEHGEDPKEAIAREYQEETGITIQPIQLFQARTGIRDGKPLLNIGYICKYISGEIKLTNEHTDFKWIKREDLKRVDFGPYSNLDIELFLSIKK